MATGVLSKNIKLYYGTAGSTASTQLKNLISIGDIGNDGIDTVEITDLESSSHEYIGGLATIPGSIEFTFNFDAAETDSSWDIVSAWNAQDVHSFKLEIPDGSTGSSATNVTATWTGYATAKISGATYNEGLKFVLTVVPKGVISFA